MRLHKLSRKTHIGVSSDDVIIWFTDFTGFFLFFHSAIQHHSTKNLGFGGLDCGGVDVKLQKHIFRSAYVVGIHENSSVLELF